MAQDQLQRTASLSKWQCSLLSVSSPVFIQNYDGIISKVLSPILSSCKNDDWIPISLLFYVQLWETTIWGCNKLEYLNEPLINNNTKAFMKSWWRVQHIKRDQKFKKGVLSITLKAYFLIANISSSTDVTIKTKTKLNSVALVREQTKPTERPPLVEVSATFCG
jgi:hypothetical protein